MPRIVRGGLIQATLCEPATSPVDKIKQTMIEKHESADCPGRRQGGSDHLPAGVVLRPVLLAEQQTKWYDLTERVPDGPTTVRFREIAKKHGIVLVLPVYEEEITGLYYNTAAVIDADGAYLGKFRKIHLPQVSPGFWEKYYFRPGNLGYPIFHTRFAEVGVYICYDRHFPEGARCLGLGGAEIVFNPSATVAGLSEYLWKLEQPAHAAANGYFVGAINRPGWEDPWRMASSTVRATSATRGQIVAQGARETDDIVIADLDLDMIREVRNTWQFYRDRRPETYTAITAP